MKPVRMKKSKLAAMAALHFNLKMDAEARELLIGLQIQETEKLENEKNKLRKVKRKNSLSRNEKNIAKTKDNLNRVLKHLKQSRDTSLKAQCRIQGSSKYIADDQVKLRCRQLPNVLRELRKSIMRQDWYETATLLLIMCHPGLTLYNSIIIRTCFILLFNHPKSKFYLLQNFVRSMTGYVLEEDVNKFIKILFALRKAPLSQLESGKFIRKTGDYKVSKDPEFENL